MPESTASAISSGYLKPEPWPWEIEPSFPIMVQCCISYNPSPMSNTPASMPTDRSWSPRAALARFSEPLRVCSPIGCSGTPEGTSTGVILTSPYTRVRTLLTASTLTLLRDPTATSSTSVAPVMPYSPLRIPEADILPNWFVMRGTTDISRGGIPLSALRALIFSALPSVSSETTRTSTESISGGP